MIRINHGTQLRQPRRVRLLQVLLGWAVPQIIILLMLPSLFFSFQMVVVHATTSDTIINQRRPLGSMTNMRRRNDKELKAQWYSKYPWYPDYCSTTDQMVQRGIPPLSDNNNNNNNNNKRVVGETRLLHVTSIVRHGARTPLQSPFQASCWDGYWSSPETGIWDCDLTTLLAPPTPLHIMEEEGTKLVSAAKSMFLFDKQYNALLPSGGGGGGRGRNSNVFNGTCQLGQLLLQGYDQLLINGHFLRNAYLYESGTYSHDVRMRLFDLSTSSRSSKTNDATTTTMDPWDAPNLYLRADDEQRTMMSGQVLIRGLFGPELQQSGRFHRATFPTLPVHTSDHGREIMSGIKKHYNCPKLDALKKKALSSKAYSSFYNDPESQQVRNFLQQEIMPQKGPMGSDEEEGSFDCLMTALCTDRPLPHGIDIENDTLGPQRWIRRIGTYVSVLFLAASVMENCIAVSCQPHTHKTH
jgi:Histidine phosphatase superfamily (branch 2)